MRCWHLGMNSRDRSMDTLANAAVRDRASLRARDEKQSVLHSLTSKRESWLFEACGLTGEDREIDVNQQSYDSGVWK